MLVSEITLKELREIINEKPIYRSGPELVKFFNSLGFNDYYSKNFPSRWRYTDEKLLQINGTPEIDKCIKMVFEPQKYIGKYNLLDDCIDSFNKYLAFDNWKVIRNGKYITFTKADNIDFSYNVDEKDKEKSNKEKFLKKEYNNISFDKIGIEGTLVEVLNLRLVEIQKCLSAEASLAVIFLSGSVLEGLLLGLALKYPREFNQSVSAPKKEGICKKFPEWTLSNLIEVACDLKFIGEDVKKYSHSLRDFRNYIHPYMQRQSQFNPSFQTAQISFQVLKAAIFEIKESLSIKP